MFTLNDSLSWRYATNLFTDTKVSDDDLLKIVEAGNLMPTAYGLQPFRFVVVSDPEIKNSLVEHSYGQKYVADNSHLIVVATRTDIDEGMISEYISRLETTRNLPSGAADGFKNMMVGDLTNRTPEARLDWAKKQAYLALGGMIAAASALKIDNHALEGFNPEEYNKILGLNDLNLTATVLLAIGYRSDDDTSQHYAKVRVPAEEMLINK